MNTGTRFARSFILYVATLLFFGVGAITTLGIDWYATLRLPSWAPPELVVALIWFVLFLCTAFSVIRFWEHSKRDEISFRSVIYLYVLNSFLVLLWNYLFFGVHELGFAFAAAVAVGVSVAILIFRLWREARTSALLLVPYLAWMLFALLYTYTVMSLNA
ncbi:MAG: Tryptophan-rich sensory protein [Parcubacteria bacterium C7867-004]|nr:MAG: Tryptophan-rich sensory protein [Parcubacteria bacterium C7867-004]